MSYAKPPVLTGSSKSDYENYLRTDELLSLQKSSDQWEHRDELLFTIVHQTSELWLKLASSEVSDAIESLRQNNLREPQRLLSRAVLCIHQTHNALDMLEKMSPWDYQQVRRALGHGSGFDSPGFNSLRKAVPELYVEYMRLLKESGTALIEVFLSDRENEDLFQLAEWLIELDSRIASWRERHLKVVERSIGILAVGTQGTPVETMAKLVGFRFFPELWNVRSEITGIALMQESEGESPSRSDREPQS
jgi:tryptophan 2,3-dioxygenase